MSDSYHNSEITFQPMAPYDALDHRQTQSAFTRAINRAKYSLTSSVSFRVWHSQWCYLELYHYTPFSPRIILAPIVPNQYFWRTGRISAKQSGTCGQSQAIVWEGLERSGAIASVLREPGTENEIGYCFKHVQKQKPIKIRRPLVILVVRGSSEGRLVSPALWSFHVPSGALFYPREPSYTLCSSLSRIVRWVHKESIVTKYNSKIWFCIYSKSL